MTVSSQGPNPDAQSRPSPESPPGAPSSTPVPRDVLISNPTNTPAGQADVERYRKFFYYSSVGMMVLCPTVALLPPRKLDLYTLGLGIAWVLSASHVTQEKTGKTLMWHVASRLPGSSANSQALAAEAERQQASVSGAAKKLWQGQETEDWVDKRKKREQEYLDDGRGYQGLIVDYVREAVGIKKEGEDAEE